MTHRISRRAFVASLAAVTGCAAPRPPSRSTRPSSGEISAPSAAIAPSATPAPEPEPTPPPATPPLFAAFPKLAAAVPRLPLGVFPTAVEHAMALGAAIGVDALYIKRDDQSGVIYGGGKPRKLEILLAAALRDGKKVVATIGGVGSNHALATAIYARGLGLGARLLLLPEPASDHVREHLLGDLAFGASMRMAKGQADAEEQAKRAWPDDDLAWIPAGGTSALGNVGFVNAGFELAAQISAGALPKPDRIYMAMGTMGSAVGLSIGLRAAGVNTSVIAVRASSPGTSSREKLGACHDETATYLRSLDPTFPKLDSDPRALRIDGAHLGAGYARSTPKGDAAMNLAARLAELELEPVYTAKALAALIDDAPSMKEERVLFWSSANGRKLSLERVDTTVLPRELRGYFPRSGSSI